VNDKPQTSTLDREVDEARETTRTDPAPATTADIARAQTPATQGPSPAGKDAHGEGPSKAPSTERADDGKASPLFDSHATAELRDRWDEIQAGFVDEPRAAVEHADALVADVMKRLAESFAGERRSLEEQWSRGDDVSTEELRVALRRYRSFFDRLLSV
jgi:hypothetical protein